MLDGVIVVSALVEIALGSGADGIAVLRILRIARILRSVKQLRRNRECRLIIASISNGMAS